MTYRFESLLASHYKTASSKEAFWGTMARGAMGAAKALPTAAKAVGGALFGPGKSMASKIGFGVGTAASLGSAMNSGKNGPSINSPFGKITPDQSLGGMQVTASLSEPFLEKAALQILGPKFASELPDWHRALNVASYGAFTLPYLSKSIHDNKALSTLLNTAGLLGLGTTAGHGLAHGDKPAAWDLAGLGLMGAGMLHSGLKGT